MGDGGAVVVGGGGGGGWGIKIAQLINRTEITMGNLWWKFLWGGIPFIHTHTHTGYFYILHSCQ